MNARAQGMECPIDGTQLLMSDRQGIEIDYCPACRGVWLDRGELDKIVERSQHEPSGRVHSAGLDHHDRRRKQRKSFLEELFD